MMPLGRCGYRLDQVGTHAYAFGGEALKEGLPLMCKARSQASYVRTFCLLSIICPPSSMQKAGVEASLPCVNWCQCTVTVRALLWVHIRGCPSKVVEAGRAFGYQHAPFQQWQLVTMVEGTYSEQVQVDGAPASSSLAFYTSCRVMPPS
eukprot:scaffold75218_cov20-Tisochrysis_lutea.AAC.2